MWNDEKAKELNRLAKKAILTKSEKKHMDYLLELWEQDQELLYKLENKSKFCGMME